MKLSEFIKDIESYKALYGDIEISIDGIYEFSTIYQELTYAGDTEPCIKSIDFRISQPMTTRAFMNFQKDTLGKKKYMERIRKSLQ